MLFDYTKLPFKRAIRGLGMICDVDLGGGPYRGTFTMAVFTTRSLLWGFSAVIILIKKSKLIIYKKISE